MAAESEFVEVAKKVAEAILPSSLLVKRGEALLYQVSGDNQLSLTVNVKHPRSWQFRISN